jgi:hypothetical protein
MKKMLFVLGLVILASPAHATQPEPAHAESHAFMRAALDYLQQNMLPVSSVSFMREAVVAEVSCANNQRGTYVFTLKTECGRTIIPNLCRPIRSVQLNEARTQACR